jgi:hypothetical protein
LRKHRGYRTILFIAAKSEANRLEGFLTLLQNCRRNRTSFS